MSNLVVEWKSWIIWGLFSALTGAGVGAVIGLVNESSGTAVAVGMSVGIVIGIDGLSQWLVLTKQFPQKGLWALTTKLIGVFCGAINLGVGAVVVVISFWNIFLRGQIQTWVTISSVIGAIGGVVGGIIAGMVLLYLLKQQQVEELSS